MFSERACHYKGCSCVWGQIWMPPRPRQQTASECDSHVIQPFALMLQQHRTQTVFWLYQPVLLRVQLWLTSVPENCYNPAAQHRRIPRLTRDVEWPHDAPETLPEHGEDLIQHGAALGLVHNRGWGWEVEAEDESVLAGQEVEGGALCDPVVV